MTRLLLSRRISSEVGPLGTLELLGEDEEDEELSLEPLELLDGVLDELPLCPPQLDPGVQLVLLTLAVPPHCVHHDA
ncbi:MAG: hypothetical protein KAI73_09880 [Rhodospirillaceae bacterium]|nr:hypothetical protein [Rhodospirillaceae bacterium]